MGRCGRILKQSGESSYFIQFVVLLSRDSRCGALRSMPKAPKGAVIRMASTATERTVLPQDRPIVRGTPPIAAWTVALGR